MTHFFRLEFREAIGTSSHVPGQTSMETEFGDDVRCCSLENFDNELNNKQKQENKQNLFKTMSKLTKDIKSRLFYGNPLKGLKKVLISTPIMTKTDSYSSKV